MLVNFISDLVVSSGVRMWWLGAVQVCWAGLLRTQVT